MICHGQKNMPFPWGSAGSVDGLFSACLCACVLRLFWLCWLCLTGGNQGPDYQIALKSWRLTVILFSVVTFTIVREDSAEVSLEWRVLGFFLPWLPLKSCSHRTSSYRVLEGETMRIIIGFRFKSDVQIHICPAGKKLRIQFNHKTRWKFNWKFFASQMICKQDKAQISLKIMWPVLAFWAVIP